MGLHGRPARAANHVQVRANIKDRGPNQGQPGSTPIGSPQGGAPDRRNDTELNETGCPQGTRTELARSPDINQADNSRGSQDQTRGSRTGSDIGLIPEENEASDHELE